MDYRKKYAELLRDVCRLKEQYAYRSVKKFYNMPQNRELRSYQAGQIAEEQAIVRDLEKIISVESLN